MERTRVRTCLCTGGKTAATCGGGGGQRRRRRRPGTSSPLERKKREKGKGKREMREIFGFWQNLLSKNVSTFWIPILPLKNKSIVVVVVMPLPALATTTTTTHRECVETRRFFFGAKESFAEKLEAVKTARSRMTTMTVVASCPKGGETCALKEEEEKRRGRRARLALARVVAEWTLSVLPTIVLDVGGSEDGKRKKQKKTAAARRQHNFGKAFGSLDEEKEEALRTKANVETLWRTLTDALIICQEEMIRVFEDDNDDEKDKRNEDDDVVGEDRTMEEPVPFNPANANRMVKCFSESMKLFADDGDSDSGESVLSKCSDVLSNVLSASKYAPSLDACTEMCVVAFERFPEMREASLRLCARQLRRKDFGSRSRGDDSNGVSVTVATSMEKQQNVTKEFVDVLLSADTSDNVELMKLSESAMRLTVARESVLRYYPDAFEKTKDEKGYRQNRGEKRKKQEGDGDAGDGVSEEDKLKINRQIPTFILQFAKRITNARDSHAIRFAPWFFEVFCASKERKRNAATTKKIAEKALRDTREVFSRLFGAIASASSKEKEKHIVNILRAIKTKEDVYEAYDKGNPPKIAIEAFLVKFFGEKDENMMNYANILDAVLSIDFRLLEKKAESCILRVGLNGTAATAFLLNLMTAFATRRKFADFVECVGCAFKRVPNESEDELHGMNALFRSETILKALERHASSMLEGQREELFEMCAKVLGTKKSTKLLTTFGMVVKSIHKGISDSFTREQCDKLGRNEPRDWAIYDAMAINPVVGDILMNNRTLFDDFIQHVRELKTTIDFISIFPCAMQALSNDSFSNEKAKLLIDCILTDEKERDDGTDMRYDLLHQHASTWIKRASRDQAMRYFASRIRRRKFAALDDFVSATLWIDALCEWLRKSATNSEKILIDVMEALELQMSSSFSHREKADVKEREDRFYTSLEALALAAEEVVSKLANKIKSPSPLKTILRVRSKVDTRNAQENLSPSTWPHRKSTRDALGKIGDSIPESAWLPYLEEYAVASYPFDEEDENLSRLSSAKIGKLYFKDAMALAVACKQMRDALSDEDDKAIAAWVKKFEKREEVFESLLAKFKNDVKAHATSVCFGYALAGLGHSLRVRAKTFSSLSSSSEATQNVMRSSGDSVASHLDRALHFVEELKGDLNTNTKAMMYLYGCVSLLASPGIAFETEAFMIVFTALLKNFHHFSSHKFNGAVTVLNELHRERTKCLRVLFESSSKEARRFAVQFATDRLRREDALARNSLIEIDADSALLSAQNLRMQSTFWMLEAFTSCSKFAWQKTFDDERNESLVDSLLHACEPHLNKVRCLTRRRSLAILCNLIAKGDYECALSARAVGRIVQVSARAFGGTHTETEEMDFESFTLCCDIVTATMYHRKEQLKRSTNIITAAIAHLVDVLRQWSSISSHKIEHHEAFIQCAASLSKSLEACKASGIKKFYCAHILAEVIASVTATSDNRKIEINSGNENNTEIFASIRDRLKPGIFKLFEACSDLEFSYIFAMYGEKGIGGARRVAFSTLREEQKAAKA